LGAACFGGAVGIASGVITAAVTASGGVGVKDSASGGAGVEDSAWRGLVMEDSAWRRSCSLEGDVGWLSDS